MVINSAEIDPSEDDDEPAIRVVGRRDVKDASRCTRGALSDAHVGAALVRRTAEQMSRQPAEDREATARDRKWNARRSWAAIVIALLSLCVTVYVANRDPEPVVVPPPVVTVVPPAPASPVPVPGAESPAPEQPAAPGQPTGAP